MVEKKSIELPSELKGKKFRIRKLTPRECFRLMDVDDADIDKIQAYPFENLERKEKALDDKDKKSLLKQCISNSAQYKLAGNSIVVNVLLHIFRKMFVEIEPDGNSGPVQLSLF
jgi:site-specific DNA-cytosine methylase